MGTFDAVSTISKPGRPEGSTASWDNYYVRDGDRVSGVFGDGGVAAGLNGDFVAGVGGPWAPQEGANNFAVPNWIGKNDRESGHMQLFWPKALEAE